MLGGTGSEQPLKDGPQQIEQCGGGTAEGRKPVDGKRFFQQIQGASAAARRSVGRSVGMAHRCLVPVVGASGSAGPLPPPPPGLRK